MTRATSALIAALFAVSIFAGPVSADALGDCTNAHDTDAAISGCSQIIEGGSTNEEQLAFAYNNRASALSARGRHQAAIDDYDRALALRPHYVNAHYNRGSLHLDLGGWRPQSPTSTRSSPTRPNDRTP